MASARRRRKAPDSAVRNRSEHQQIVAARGGDFEGALGALLALHIGEVEPYRARRREPRLGRRQQLGALEMIDDRQEARRRDHLHLARPGRLAAAFGRADAAAVARGRQGSEQHAGDARQRAVERHLPKGRLRDEVVRRQRVHCCQQAERDRQVEMAAFLDDIGWGKIDRDPPRRQPKPQRGQGRADPLAQLGDRLVRQSDDDKGRRPGGEAFRQEGRGWQARINEILRENMPRRQK